MTAYAPKHQKQLNGSPTAGEDCWARSVQMAVDFATVGDLVPSIDAIRDRANVPTGGANTADQERAVESYDTPEETKKREDLKFDRHVGDPWEGDGLPVDAMKNDSKVVILSIDYGVVNDQRPDLSGDRAFDGGHSVMFGETRVKDDKLQVLAYDSLYDGRRPEIPNGPQWWPSTLARDAAYGFAGQGLWTGGIVPRAYLLDDSDPDPEPTPDTEAQMRLALEEERTALYRIIEDATARIAYVDTIIPTNASQASAPVASGQRAEDP